VISEGLQHGKVSGHADVDVRPVQGVEPHSLRGPKVDRRRNPLDELDAGEHLPDRPLGRTAGRQRQFDPVYTHPACGAGFLDANE
jgi:hypothetical protein